MENCIHDNNYICTVTINNLLCEDIDNCKFKIKKMKSKLGKLSIKDLLKGALVAMVTIVATSLLTIVESGEILSLLEWITLKPIVLAGIGGFLAYILKNWLTNSDDKILKKEIK